MRTHSKFIPLLMRQVDLHTQLLCRFSSFWARCIYSSNSLIQICAHRSISSNSNVAHNLLEICRVLNCDIEFIESHASEVSNFLLSNFLSNINDDDIALSILIKDLLDVRSCNFENFFTSVDIESLLIVICTS